MNGIDCATRLTTLTAQALKQAGIEVVGRYLGYNHGWTKALTPDEVKAIHAAGLAIFIIWESAPINKGYFSYDKGVADAKQAIIEAEYLGVPQGAAIYFTIDYDASKTDMVYIEGYLQGVRDGLAGKYLLGVYGSFLVMTSVKADRYFQTYAWSGGQKAPNHIYQYQNDVTVQGIAVDRDCVNEDAGLWKGSEDVLEVAVLLYTKDDFWAGADVSIKNGNSALFIRPEDHSVPKDAMSAKTLIVVGGPTTGHSNEVLLSGNTKYDTAAKVAEYLK